MYSQDDIVRLESIKTKIETIYSIVDRHDGIFNALSDIEGQPAILMLLVATPDLFSFLAL